MKTLTLALIALTLSACATTGSSGPSIVNGNDRSVMVTGACDTATRSSAFSQAETHCRQFDRHARVNRVDACVVSFDCVE